MSRALCQVHRVTVIKLLHMELLSTLPTGSRLANDLSKGTTPAGHVAVGIDNRGTMVPSDAIQHSLSFLSMATA